MVRLLCSPRVLRSIAPALFVLLWAHPVLAQSASASDAQAPAHISYVDGAVIVERDGRIDESPGSMPLLAGDRVRTRIGRAEILFGDGSTLHLDYNSAVDLQSDELVRLIQGRVRLSIPGPARQASYRIDAPHGWAHVGEPGDYRVALMQSAGGSELELAVIRGSAELANESGQTPLRAGERAFARAGAAPSDAYVANSAALDDFDRWSEARRDVRMTASAEYLPEEVRPYASSFEQYGYWRDEPVYGRVWYPRVGVGWRPYYRGRWASLRPYGWTWIAHDPWGWPTHHYGRWGVSSGGAWFWIPGRTWGAAWVSWAYAPGYVSWCPLGWNNRALFQLNVVNVHGGWDPWRAWTVVPYHRFGYGYVHTYSVRASHIDHRTLSAFSYRDRAPEIIGHAVPRASAPIRFAGTGLTRRGAAPLYTNLPAGQGRMRTDGARVRVPDASSGAAADRPTDIARERAVPTRPAVRADRSGTYDPGANERPNTRRLDSPGVTRSEVVPGARRRTDVPSAAPNTDPSSVEYRRAVPRYGAGGGGRSGGSPDPAAQSPAQRRMEMPSYGRPSPIQPQAVPRSEPSGSAGQARAPQVDRRGPDRAPSGSYGQRSPAAASPAPAQPSARGGGGAAAAPSAGARPGGGAPAGARPRGGRGGR